MDEAVLKRFFAKISIRENGCHMWTASTIAGYGAFGFGGTQRAHVMAWRIKHGYWPTDCVLHKCDNRGCVNPEHLFLGSRKDNMTDAIKKGRMDRLGLSDELKKEIQVAFEKDKNTSRLARRFKLSRSTIRRVVGKLPNRIYHEDRYDAAT